MAYRAVPKLGLKLDDRSLQIAVGLRLGVSLCHPYKCGSCDLLVYTTARHGLSCTKAKGSKPRHDKINDILLRAMGAARHTSAPQGLCLDDSKQPDGITLFSWKHGMQLVWDFFFTARPAANTINQSSWSDVFMMLHSWESPKTVLGSLRPCSEVMVSSMVIYVCLIK